MILRETHRVRPRLGRDLTNLAQARFGGLRGSIAALSHGRFEGSGAQGNQLLLSVHAYVDFPGSLRHIAGWGGRMESLTFEDLNLPGNMSTCIQIIEGMVPGINRLAPSVAKGVHVLLFGFTHIHHKLMCHPSGAEGPHGTVWPGVQV